MKIFSILLICILQPSTATRPGGNYNSHSHKPSANLYSRRRFTQQLPAWTTVAAPAPPPFLTNSKKTSLNTRTFATHNDDTNNNTPRKYSHDTDHPFVIRSLPAHRINSYRSDWAFALIRKIQLYGLASQECILLLEYLTTTENLKDHTRVYYFGILIRLVTTHQLNKPFTGPNLSQSPESTYSSFDEPEGSSEDSDTENPPTSAPRMDKNLVSVFEEFGMKALLLDAIRKVTECSNTPEFYSSKPYLLDFMRAMLLYYPGMYLHLKEYFLSMFKDWTLKEVDQNIVDVGVLAYSNVRETGLVEDETILKMILNAIMETMTLANEVSENESAYYVIYKLSQHNILLVENEWDHTIYWQVRWTNGRKMKFRLRKSLIDKLNGISEQWYDLVNFRPSR